MLKLLRGGLLKRLHVNQHRIRGNISLPPDQREQVLTVKMSNERSQYGDRIEILDKDGGIACTLIYSPDKPLSCGARVWLETTNEVVIK